MRSCLLILSFFLLGFSSLEAQTSTKVTDSGWRIGMNIGGAYQGKPIGENDLDPAFGMGWGFTLGRMLYREPGDFFNVGLRGRFLWEMTRGISTERHYAIGVHPRSGNDKRFDLDMVGQRYQDSVGYVYSNYRQEGREYDLELTLGFNRWAEETNLYFYLFGGIGVINYQVQTDQLDSDGSVYRYDQELSKNPSKSELRDMWDGDYETRVYEGGKVDRFISSLGAGLIYQINRSLGVGIEHKISFPDNEDRFDAKEFESGFDPKSHSGGRGAAYDAFSKTSRQDLYHYTALSFRWRILNDESEDKEEKEDEARADDYTDYDEDDNVVQGKSPEVEIINPSQDPYKTNKDSILLRASVQHVEQEENVTLLIDGQEHGDPHFEPANNLLEQKIGLSTGAHQVRVEGVNERGSDADEVRIVRESKKMAPPEVRISHPSGDPFNANDPAQKLRATVLNVSEKDSIDFRFNGKKESFSFDASSGELKAKLDLIQGANIVKVSAWNEAGKDREEQTILFKKRSELTPPQVWIAYPDPDPHVVHASSSKIKARVEDIASRHDITVTHNGQSVQAFNYYPQSGVLTMKRDLELGNNHFRIKVKDQGGSDMAEQRIIRREEQSQPPKVDFVRPSSSGSVVKSSNYRVEADLEHVDERSQLVFKMNGNQRSGFAFSANDGKLIYDASLQKGKNHFVIKASNSDGTAKATRSIRYEKKASGNLPSIQVVDPGSDPAKVQKAKKTVNAQVEHVSDKSRIKVSLNGDPVSNFQYDAASGKLSLKASLVEGSNRFSFVAINQHGMDEASQTIIYDPQDPPLVNIVDPGKKKTVNDATYSVRAKLLRVPNASGISFQVNGQATTTFNYDPNSGKFKGQAKLQKGSNTILLKGTNPNGSDQDQVKLRYKKATPPTVSITKPKSDPHKTPSKKVVIKGKVNGVDDRSDLTLTDNGQSVSNFKFNQSGHFKYLMKLKTGSNEFRILAKNPAGKDEAKRRIIRSSSSSMKDQKSDPKGKKKSGKKGSPQENDSSDPEEEEVEDKNADPSSKGDDDGSKGGGQIEKDKKDDGGSSDPKKGGGQIDKGKEKDDAPSKKEDKKGGQVEKDKK